MLWDILIEIAVKFVAIVVITVPGAWVVMLGIGAAHDAWPGVPALGYASTYLMLAALGVIAGALRATPAAQD